MSEGRGEWLKNAWKWIKEGLSLKDLITTVGLGSFFISLATSAGVALLAIVDDQPASSIVVVTIWTALGALLLTKQFTAHRSGLFGLSVEAQPFDPVDGTATTSSATSPLGGTVHRPWATLGELQQPVIRNRSLHIYDLPRTGVTISGRTFIECDIFGPAMIALGDGVMVSGLVILIPGQQNREAVEAHFTEVEEGYVVGVLGLQDCVIRQCRMSEVGFIGNRETMSRVREAFPVPADEEAATPEESDSSGPYL